MPIGGDLGFSYLVLVVLFVGPLIGFVVRRKWRLSVARTEEIKRLLVLASEEAARAELEASISYTTSVPTTTEPIPYQCAVCFSPTTTRCARCKSVRYCSGKCQIIHWRQGHKEECRPFSTSYQSNEGGGVSSEKVLKQEELKIQDISFDEGRQSTKSVQNFSEEPASSKSDFSSEYTYGNGDSEVECISDRKGTNSNSRKTERLDGHFSSNMLSDKLETNLVHNDLPQTLTQTALANSVDCPISLGKLNQIKANCIDRGAQCGSTSSSGWSVNGSDESSFSEPLTPSSGFWEGTINSTRTKFDALDDSAESNSSVAGDADMHSSQSFLGFSLNIDKNAVLPVQGSSTKSDDAHSSSLGIKKPMDRAVLSEERSGLASSFRSSPLFSPEKPDHRDVSAKSAFPVMKSRESKYCSSAAYACSTSSTGGSSNSKKDLRVSSVQSLNPERSNQVLNDTNSTSHPLESIKNGTLPSNASVAQPLSSTRRHSLLGENSGKVDNASAVAVTSDYAISSSNSRNGLKTSMWQVVDQLKASKSSRHYHSGVCSESAGRYNDKGLFPYELFVKLYTWNKTELRPCGLINCGNSCYANAVLQCLACTPPLTAYFLQGLHSKACERKGWCFTCEFESLILKAKEGTSPLSPIRILSQIQNIGINLGNGREEDAHEFLRYAIDTMQSVCLKEAGSNASSSSEEETTLIGLTFGGYLRSKIKCMKCGGKSERHERMMDLTVEIEGDIGTLEEALRQFTGTELLDGENKYECSRCRTYERAKKKLTVLEAPNILTIALKRFQSGKFGKLNKSIQFPEILNLAPYMSRTSDKLPIYRLYGVVVHLDMNNAAFSGHYVCYVKNVQSKWFKIDDSSVKAVDLENVLTKRAYMLLYARCSPRAPRLLRNSIIPRDPRKSKNPMFKMRSHTTAPWGASSGDPINGHIGIECLYPNHVSFCPIRTVREEDSSSDNSSSIFSEGCSCSTESSNRDSTSTEDYFDHFLGDLGQNWKNSSDSDSSSSSSSPSPLADSDRYLSRFWARPPSKCSSRVPFLNSDSSKFRNLDSSSCRDNDSDRLESTNPFDNKKSGVSFRGSTRERPF